MDYRLKFGLAIFLLINVNRDVFGMEKSPHITSIELDGRKRTASDLDDKSCNSCDGKLKKIVHDDERNTSGSRLSSGLATTLTSFAHGLRKVDDHSPEGAILQAPAIDPNRADTATMPAGCTPSDWWWQAPGENNTRESTPSPYEELFPGQQRK